MRIIYLLELANSKFFVLAHGEPVINVHQFFLESVLKYNYLKVNKPIRIVDQCQELHSLDLDACVKKQMMIRGIDKVRGGSYSSIFLDTHQTIMLRRELSPSNECPDHVIKEIIQKYGSLSPVEAINKKTQLKTEFAKYKKEKNAFETIKMDTALYRKHLEWIRAKCHEQITTPRNTVLYQILNHEDVKIYRDIFPIFNIIYQTFLTNYERPVDTVYADVLVKQPEFVFDDFIYHGDRIHLSESIEGADQLISKYLFFLTFIENRIAELEFDVSSWGQNPEDMFHRAIYFLGLTKKDQEYH